MTFPGLCLSSRARLATRVASSAILGCAKGHLPFFQNYLFPLYQKKLFRQVKQNSIGTEVPIENIQRLSRLLPSKPFEDQFNLPLRFLNASTRINDGFYPENFFGRFLHE